MACLPRMSIPSQALPFAKGPTSFLLSPFPRPRLHFSRFSFTSSGFSSPFHLHHSFRGFPSQSCPMSYRRHATNPGSSSPETDPPFEDDPIPATEVACLPAPQYNPLMKAGFDPRPLLQPPGDFIREPAGTFMNQYELACFHQLK
uniref:Uncharacterized protein n=1 Tax=Nelumbo nucifera TaxID=4432 RepID=A0A822Y773_NELNU|nr:TPA_asm: hypothetical protein HUJ06_028647 [Nelumbo nucifera]